MKTICSLVAASLFAVLAGCDKPAPAADPATPTEEEVAMPESAAACPVLDSRDWTAWVNAMPGPDASATLIVEGVVDMPTPGFTFTWEAGMADRSAIPVQRLHLSAAPPDGMVAQVVTSESVRYEGPAIAKQYRGVTVMCGDAVIAEITDVTTAE